MESSLDTGTVGFLCYWNRAPHHHTRSLAALALALARLLACSLACSLACLLACSLALAREREREREREARSEKREARSEKRVFVRFARPRRQLPGSSRELLNLINGPPFAVDGGACRSHSRAPPLRRTCRAPHAGCPRAPTSRRTTVVSRPRRPRPRLHSPHSPRRSRAGSMAARRPERDRSFLMCRVRPSPGRSARTAEISLAFSLPWSA